MAKYRLLDNVTVFSHAADGASAVAFDFDTDNTYSTAGAKLFSLKNNGTEWFSVDKGGVIAVGDTAGNKLWEQSNALYLQGGSGILLGDSPSSTGDHIKITDTSVLASDRQLSTVTFGGNTQALDWVTQQISLVGNSANASATTNLDGGAVNITGGAGASGSAGDADGGDVVISGGQEYGTGSVGNIMLPNIPTSDPSVAGALWSNSGVLTVSSG